MVDLMVLLDVLVSGGLWLPDMVSPLEPSFISWTRPMVFLFFGVGFIGGILFGVVFHKPWLAVVSILVGLTGLGGTVYASNMAENEYNTKMGQYQQEVENAQVMVDEARRGWFSTFGLRVPESQLEQLGLPYSEPVGSQSFGVVQAEYNGKPVRVQVLYENGKLVLLNEDGEQFRKIERQAG